MSLVLENVGLTVNQECYLKDINLCFEPGAFNVLLGRTLAGKTSLMRTIAGLERSATGRVILHGKDITNTPVQKRQLSMVYQQFINYPHLSVYENIASPLKLAGVSKAEIKRRVSEIAELLSIGEFLNTYPLSLSGGQQQRCAMARALVKDAQIVLFDEPLVNLDYKLRESLRRELRSLFKARESIAIYATTEAHEALALGGNTVLLHEGSVLQSGSALEQFYNPNSLDAADLYHEPPLNRFQCSVRNKQIIDSDAAISGNLTSVPNINDTQHLENIQDGQYTFAVRPDKINILNDIVSDEPYLVFDAIVDLAEISASETYVHMRLDSSDKTTGLAKKETHWVAHLNGIHQLETNSTIQVSVLLKDLFVFDHNGKRISCPTSAHHAYKEAV